jgi:acetyltransferase-like isoleucine patch superfamily enzyme
LGKHCNIGDHCFVESGTVLGDRVTLKNASIVCEGVEIGDDTFIGTGVMFMNDKSPRSPRMADVQERYEDRRNWLLRTTVGAGASIGSGTLVLPGLSIGAFALVAAGSLVTKNVPAHALVMGSPARQVGWVCVCGNRLDEQHSCVSCGKTYREEELTVNLLAGASS